MYKKIIEDFFKLNEAKQKEILLKKLFKERENKRPTKFFILEKNNLFITVFVDNHIEIEDKTNKIVYIKRHNIFHYYLYNENSDKNIKQTIEKLTGFEKSVNETILECLGGIN